MHFYSFLAHAAVMEHIPMKGFSGSLPTWISE